MTPEKQQKMYGVLMFFSVVLLLAAQFVLQHTLRGASEQLISLQSSLAQDQKQLGAQRSLSERYAVFERLATGQGGTERQFPLNGRELFTALAAVLTNYQIEFTNTSPNREVQPGGNFVLTIRFKGPYYNVIKALAAIRESHYIMRMSELRLNAVGGGVVEGNMSIVSTAQS
ncbi:MAG: hypothetical protein LBR87_04540 [Synergistaceae bacterium]|nr:hypothetical protein [Synergistaceae bacterium]